MPKKSRTPKKDEDDDLTPKQRRKLDAQLAISEAQAKAGLTYGPIGDGAKSLQALLKAGKRTRRISIQLPAVLLDFLALEAKRLGMTTRELIVTILETHRFADHKEQLITLAISESKGQFKTGRYQS